MTPDIVWKPDLSDFKLEFEEHRTEVVAKDAMEDPRYEIDEKIASRLIAKIKRVGKDKKVKKGTRSNVNYLDMLGHPAANGIYKVGRTHSLRRLDEHERCYPNLILFCFIYCPNAELFEQLFQDEFSSCRRSHTCKVHKDTRHDEWFEAPLQEIMDSVNAWAFFAQMVDSNDAMTNRQLNCPFPGFSKSPTRWRDWAKQHTEQWMRERSNRHTSIESMASELEEALKPEPERTLHFEATPERFSTSANHDLYTPPPTLSHDLATPSPGLTPGTPNNVNRDPFGPASINTTQKVRATSFGQEPVSPADTVNTLFTCLTISEEDTESAASFKSPELPSTPTRVRGEPKGLRVPLARKNANIKIHRGKQSA